MKYVLIIFLVSISCNISQKKNKEQITNNKTIYSTNCQEDFFSKSENLKGLVNKKGHNIPFSLLYKKDTCYFSENIKFYKIDIMLKSEDYFKLDLSLGVKRDSIFIANIFNSRIESIKYLFSFKENKPRNLKNMFFVWEELTIDTIYYRDNDKIFRINSSYYIPHDTIPKYTFYKFYLSKKRGLFKVDVINNENEEIYSTHSVDNTSTGDSIQNR